MPQGQGTRKGDQVNEMLEAWRELGVFLVETLDKEELVAFTEETKALYQKARKQMLSQWTAPIPGEVPLPL